MNEAVNEDSARRSELVELQRTLYTSRNPTRRWLHLDRRDRILTAVESAAQRTDAARAVEIGPGSGTYLPRLCELFGEVTATDIEDEYLDGVRAEVAPDLDNLTLLRDDIARSELPAGEFDLVLCSEVIEHTPAPEAVVAGLARLLRPGGVLVLSTPQPFSTVEVLGRVAFLPGVIQVVRAIYREPILPTGHISLISRERLGEMIERSGLRITGSDLSGLYIPGLAEVGGRFALRLEQRLAPALLSGPLAFLLWTQFWFAERPR